MRQLIIARKDLNMSAGKLAAQVSHASMAFISNKIKQNTVRTILNWYHTQDEEIGNVLTYSRPDLDKLCKEEYEKGNTFFFAKEVDGIFVKTEEEEKAYRTRFIIDAETYEEWFQGSFVKTVCEARNRNHLLKAIDMAKELGLVEGVDFFLIKDNCLTELEPEEVDDKGVGRTLTCIGFRPLPDEVAHKISKKYQLYK